MTAEQKTYERVITEVAKKYDLPYKVVDKTYRGFWKFVRASLIALPLKQQLSEEEYSRLRTSVNIPSLGKFSCDYERYQRMRRRGEIILKLREYGNNKN